MRQMFRAPCVNLKYYDTMTLSRNHLYITSLLVDFLLYNAYSGETG